MTRTAFLAALEQLLAPLPESERKDALSYYEDYLDAAGPENEARAIAELGSPEEVARKILDEQTPAGSSAAPASPARKPHSRWRMVLGGGLAVLVLVCFFFQHSKATPVQPVESISPSSEIPASSAEVPAESSSTQPAVPVSTPDGLTFSLSAEMVSDKLSLTLDYGTVLFVVDPNASDITLQFDGFRTRYLTHSNKKEGTAEFSYHVPKYYALPDIDSAVLTITAPENILHKVDIDLAMGDVGTLSLEELDLELAMGDVSADSLTVKEADFNLAMGDCHIDHLTAPKFDAELAVGDCKIGMLSGAQDVSISVITGDTDLTLEGSASDYYLVTNELKGTSIHDGKANTSRKVSLDSVTGDLSISYTN